MLTTLLLAVAVVLVRQVLTAQVRQAAQVALATMCRHSSQAHRSSRQVAVVVALKAQVVLAVRQLAVLVAARMPQERAHLRTQAAAAVVAALMAQGS